MPALPKRRCPGNPAVHNKEKSIGPREGEKLDSRGPFSLLCKIANYEEMRTLMAMFLPLSSR
jgi:hypothetical protein